MALGNSILFAESSSEYAATSCFILGKYIKNFFIPYPLVYFYGYNQIPVTTFTNWKVILSIVLYLLLFAWAFMSLFYAKNKAMFFAIMFYLFNIALFSHLVVTLPDTMSDRYLFMPSVGLCIFTVLAIGQLFKCSFKVPEIKTEQKETISISSAVNMAKAGKKKRKQKTKNKKTKENNFKLIRNYQTYIYVLPIVLICSVLAVMTYERNKAWKNESTLFSTDMPHLENCARANYYYGNTRYRAYPDAATTREQDKLKEEMLYHFKKAIDITDKSFYAFWHLSRAYMNFAMYDEAYEILQKGYNIYPDEFKSHHLMGMYFYYTQDYETAIEWFEKAKELAIKNQDNYFYLAWSNYKNGEPEKGISIMEKAVESQPEYEGFYNVLGDMYFDYGEFDKGIAALEKLIEMKSDFAPAYHKLINELRDLGQDSKADTYYQKGVENGVF